MSRRIGGVNYEGRFFIVEVGDDWQTGQPLPEPSPSDQWFDRLPDFVAALNAPWNHTPINRRPFQDETPERPDKPKRSLGRLDR
jgi:hypothetical protein